MPPERVHRTPDALLCCHFNGLFCSLKATSKYFTDVLWRNCRVLLHYHGGSDIDYVDGSDNIMGKSCWAEG